jgi:ABC-type glycerol-3-phosphate transport system substrate-binding protein
MKKLLLWLVMLLLITSLVTLLFIGCAEAAEKKITLTFWHHEPVDYRIAAFQEVIDRFEAENPQIHVVQEAVPWDDVWTKSAAVIKTGTGPDFQWDNPEMNIFAYEAGGIIPVTDIVNEIDKEQSYFPAMLKPYYHDGEYWGVPMWHIPMALLYRPSLLEKYVGTTEPPKTWEELLEYSKKLTVDKDGDGVIDQYGIGICAGKTFNTADQFWVFMSQTGIDIFDKDGNVSWYNPETIKALQFYADLFKYAPPAATGWSWGEIEMNFPAGTFAMTPYFGAGLKNFWEQGITDLAAAPPPCQEGEKKGTLLRNEGIMIFKAAEERGHLDAVKKFILFVMQPENHWIITAKQEPGLYYPATKAQFDSPYFWDYEPHAKYPDFVRTLAETVEYGSLWGFSHGAVNLSMGRIAGAAVIEDMVQKVVIGGESAEEAVKWANDTMIKMSKSK